jgi:cytochrome c-type biogenesis protein CcmH
MIANATYLTFVLCAIGLTLVLSAVAISPWLRRPKQRFDLLQLNVSVFRERLAELEADYQKNQIESDDYLGQKIDLERQLLAASDLDNDSPVVENAAKRVPRVVIGLVFLWIPILAFSAYFYLAAQKSSNHQALIDFWAAQDQYAAVADDLMTGNIHQPPVEAAAHGFELLQAMQVNAHKHPLDAKRWLHLSQFYLAANDLESALASLAHAYRLAPEDNSVAMTYAQMRFLSEQGKIDPNTVQIVSRILIQNPDHEGALLLMSMATYRNQQYDEAIHWLQRLKQVRLARATPSQPIDPQIIAQLDKTINDAEMARAKLLK